VSPSRRIRMWTRIVVASAWAGSLVILGLWLLAEGRVWLPIRGVSCTFGGLASIAAGIFLFMALVSDRLVPGVGRRQSMWAAEMAVFAGMLAGLAGVLLSSQGA
jgi:hypothetical protein